jgi:hypothetical protein
MEWKAAVLPPLSGWARNAAWRYAERISEALADGCKRSFAYRFFWANMVMALKALRKVAEPTFLLRVEMHRCVRRWRSGVKFEVAYEEGEVQQWICSMVMFSSGPMSCAHDWRFRMIPSWDFYGMTVHGWKRRERKAEGERLKTCP